MDDLNSDKTLPPARAIRYDRLSDLFGQVPQCAAMLQQGPQETDGYRSFLETLRESQTPEDAVTFTAFALKPVAAIRWAFESISAIQSEHTAEDAEIAGLIQDWLDTQTKEHRWKVLQLALFAPRKSAVVYLGLAVGWSGGPFAPNDLVAIPAWRCSRAVGTGVLRAIGQAGPEHRQAYLDQTLDRAAGLFRVH